MEIIARDAAGPKPPPALRHPFIKRHPHTRQNPPFSRLNARPDTGARISAIVRPSENRRLNTDNRCDN
jgi:hypothetical protein